MYKRQVHDKTGALKYEVDAEGYVTEYERNAHGDVTLRLRHANKTTLTNHGYVGISAETVAAAVNAAGLDHGGDRGVATRYDLSLIHILAIRVWRCCGGYVQSLCGAQGPSRSACGGWMSVHLVIF